LEFDAIDLFLEKKEVLLPYSFPYDGSLVNRVDSWQFHRRDLCNDASHLDDLSCGVLGGYSFR
jgi:hypothetical protein